MTRLLRMAAAVLFVATLAAPALAESPAYVVEVDGLACPFCAYGVEKQFSRIDGVETIDVDIETGAVIVTMRDGATLDEAMARGAVEAAGFDLRDFRKGDDSR